MRPIRTIAMAACIALLFSACSKEADEAVAVKENTNPLLAYVPAGTIYAFANLEPVPTEITDVYSKRLQPVLDAMNGHVDRFQADYAAGHYADSPQAMFAKAVLDELGGELSMQGLEKLGISMHTHRTLYAMGVFPVVRFGLVDAQALRGAIGRIGAQMGLQLPEKNLDGTSYWSISEPDEPIGIYIAILDEQLVFSAFPPSAEGSLLPALLGHEMPSHSLAESNALAIMNHAKGYAPYGSGFVDMQRLADELLNPDSLTNTHLGPHMDHDPAMLDPVCVTEFEALADRAPRMTVGMTTLTANEIGMRYELELEDTLAAGLAGLVSDVPAAGDGDNFLSASLALRIGKLRSFVLEKANAIVAAPYQCEQLQDLNRQASELTEQLAIPMPPMVNNLLGLRVRLDDFDPAADWQSGKGLAVLHVDKPEMFVGMASMMVPGIEELGLAKQSKPVRVPPEVLHMDGIEVYAQQGDQAIGLSVGGQYEAELAAYMDAKPQQDGTFFSISYDMAKQMQVQRTLAKKWQATDTGHEASAFHDIASAFEESYAATLDRSSMDMKFTPDGLVVNSRITFK